MHVYIYIHTRIDLLGCLFAPMFLRMESITSFCSSFLRIWFVLSLGLCVCCGNLEEFRARVQTHIERLE